MSFALTSARGEIDISTAKARSNVKGLAGDLKSFAGAAAGGIGAGATAFGAAVAVGLGAGISRAMDFEHQMSAVQSVLGATDEQMSTLSETILKVGQDSSFTAGQVGQVAENLAKMGISAEDMVDGALKAVTDLSAATGTVPENAAMIVGQAMTQYQMAGDEAEEVADLFTRTANSSAADVDGLGVSFAYVAGQAANLGIPIEDLMTSLAILADNGMRGSRAGTSLGRVFTTILNPTKEAGEAMAKYGVHALDLEGNFVGIPALLDQLDKGFVGMTESEKSAALAEMFLSNGARALLPLLKSQGEIAELTNKSWEDYATGVTTGISASEAAAQRLDNLKGSVEKFKGALDTVLIKIGTAFLEPLKVVVDIATAFVSALGSMSAEAYTLAAALGAPIAAFGALRVASMLAYNPLIRYIPGFKQVAAAASAAALPIMVIVGALALLGLAYDKNFGGLKDWVDGVEDKIDKVKDRFDFLTQPMANTGLLDPVTGETIFNVGKDVDGFAEKAGLLGDAILSVTGIDMRKWLKEVANGLLRFPKSFNKLKKQMNQIGDVIKEKGLIAGIKDFFGEGGKGVAEAFGDGISAVPKLLGDVFKNIKTGNATLDKILSETGKSFTDFGRLIQELGQGDMDGFMDVLDRLIPRLTDLSLLVGGIVLDFAISVAKAAFDLTWDWILDQLFGENDVIQKGANTGLPHEETLSDVLLLVPVWAKALWKGFKNVAGNLLQWAANIITGKGGSSGTGLYDESGDQIMSGGGNDATLQDVIFQVGVWVKAVWNGLVDAGLSAIGNLMDWVKGQAGMGEVFGPNGSMDPALGYSAGASTSEFFVDILVGIKVFLGEMVDAAGGAISSLVSWADEQLNGKGAGNGGDSPIGAYGGASGATGGEETTIEKTVNILATLGNIIWEGAGDIGGAIKNKISHPVVSGVATSVVFLADILAILWNGALSVKDAVLEFISPVTDIIVPNIVAVGEGRITIGDSLQNIGDQIAALINGGGGGGGGYRPPGFGYKGSTATNFAKGPNPIEFHNWTLEISTPDGGVKIDFAAIWKFLWDPSTMEVGADNVEKAHDIGKNWGQEIGRAVAAGLFEGMTEDSEEKGKEGGKATWDAVAQGFWDGFFEGFAEAFTFALLFKIAELGVWLDGEIDREMEEFYGDLREIKAKLFSPFNMPSMDFLFQGASAAEAPTALPEDWVANAGQWNDMPDKPGFFEGMFDGLKEGVSREWEEFKGDWAELWDTITIDVPDINLDWPETPQWVTDIGNWVDRQIAKLKGFWRKLHFWEEGGDENPEKALAALVTPQQAQSAKESAAFDDQSGTMTADQFEWWAAYDRKVKEERQRQEAEDSFNDMVEDNDGGAGVTPSTSALKNNGLDDPNAAKTIDTAWLNANKLHAGITAAGADVANIQLPKGLLKEPPKGLSERFANSFGLGKDSANDTLGIAKTQARTLKSGLEQAQRDSFPDFIKPPPMPSAPTTPAAPRAKIDELKPTTTTNTVTTKIMADNSQFQAVMNSTVLAAARFGASIWTAHLNGDNGDAAIKYTDAMTWGGIWDGKHFTGYFDGDAAGAIDAGDTAFDIGNSWDGRTFTASFSVDTSGLDAAVQKAQDTAKIIADIMPNSPAKKGPLAKDITFDYIAENMNSAMNATVSHAYQAAASIAELMESGGLSSDLLNGAVPVSLASRPITVTNIVVNTMDQDHYSELMQNAKFGKEFGEAYYEELDLTE